MASPFARTPLTTLGENTVKSLPPLLESQLAPKVLKLGGARTYTESEPLPSFLRALRGSCSAVLQTTCTSSLGARDSASVWSRGRGICKLPRSNFHAGKQSAASAKLGFLAACEWPLMPLHVSASSNTASSPRPFGLAKLKLVQDVGHYSQGMLQTACKLGGCIPLCHPQHSTAPSAHAKYKHVPVTRTAYRADRLVENHQRGATTLI